MLNSTKDEHLVSVSYAGVKALYDLPLISSLSVMLFNLSIISTEELQELFVTESQQLLNMLKKPASKSRLKKMMEDLHSIQFELSKRISQKR